ncbi:hypothetical protein, partial [Streptococcus pneumoniae]|uniref:hypothetical protein n=1 Tax=Streptococcus pneumoniae TaxID=1313 RepID=UPI0002ADCE26
FEGEAKEYSYKTGEKIRVATKQGIKSTRELTFGGQFIISTSYTMRFLILETFSLAFKKLTIS